MTPIWADGIMLLFKEKTIDIPEKSACSVHPCLLCANLVQSCAHKARCVSYLGTHDIGDRYVLSQDRCSRNVGVPTIYYGNAYIHTYIDRTYFYVDTYRTYDNYTLKPDIQKQR